MNLPPRMRAAIPLFLSAMMAGAQSPEAHWSFDGGTAPERQNESYGRSALNLTASNGASTWSTRNGFGGVLANGFTNPWLSAPNQSALDPGSGSFTLACWVNRTSDNATAAGILDALNDTGTGYQLFYQANGTLRFRIDDNLGNSALADTAASQLVLNEWRHVIVAVNRATGRVHFHVNGTEVAPVGGVAIPSISGAVTPDQNLWIGSLNGTNPSRGQMDEVAFFKRLLTPMEIAALAGGGGSPVLTVFPPVPPLPPVVLDPPSGILRNGGVITLTSGSGAEIRYTLDGSDPGPGSPLYHAPLTPAVSGQLKARVVNGVSSGPVASGFFVRLPAAPPNVLIMVADDTGFNDLGCYGGVSAVTPRLDRLSYQGQRFTQFTTSGPGDPASQYALLTGRLARRGDLPAVAIPASGALDPREWTLTESFRKSGYHTAFFGTWHLGSIAGSLPLDQGIVHFTGLPWDGTLTPTPALIDNQTVLDPAPSDPLRILTNRARAEIAAHAHEPFLIIFQPPSLTESGTAFPGTHRNRVEALDAAAGELLDELDLTGTAANTLVVFLSDGGADQAATAYPAGSNGQQRDGKGSTWEGGARVPLLARWPGVIPPGDNQAVIGLPDIHVTLTNIVNGFNPTDRPLDGKDRIDALLGVRTRPDDATSVFLHRHTGPGYQLQTVRSGKWKLHRAFLNTDPDNTFSGTAPLLFDLLTDPGERINRAASETAVLASLQALAASHEDSFATALPQLPPARLPFLGPVASSLSATTAAFAFTRPADSLDDHYLVQTSLNLTDWVSHPSLPWRTITGVAEGLENVLVSVPILPLSGGANRFFGRLQAVRP